MIVACVNCGTPLTRKPAEIARSRTKKFTCGRSCLYTSLRNPDLDWAAIQRAYDDGLPIRLLGASWDSIQKAKLRGEFTPRDRVRARAIAIAQGRRVPYHVSEELKSRLRERAIRQGLGGKKNSTKFIYKGIVLDSSYEVRLARLLDKAGMQWCRPSPLFWVDRDGRSHRYYPDFEVTECSVFLDPKNRYLIKKDAEKISRVRTQNGVNVQVISLSTIEALERSDDLVRDLKSCF